MIFFQGQEQPWLKIYLAYSWPFPYSSYGFDEDAQ